MEWKGVDWINLAPDRNNWRVIMDTVMNIWGSVKYW
jgi:hypothetical protein